MSRVIPPKASEEALLRAKPLETDPTHAQPAMNTLGSTYHAVANLIRVAGRVEQEDIDRILYGVMP